MSINPVVQKYISVFIESQFPALYQQYGPKFIDFITAYYQWMETQGPLYDSRRLLEYQDIDTTNVDRFLIYFKDKYLPNIQLETVSNVKLLIKHSLDIYRSRGTPRAIDLLFRLVFGIGADVYYPFDDVFQPSSGEWIIPHYIEVSTQDDLNKFVGKEIVGITSGAQAFVESWIRKKAGNKQIDVLYISSVEGTFQTSERINAVKSPFVLLTCPTIIGSLTRIDITDGAFGFNIGDIIDVKGTKGYGGTARVANVGFITGTVQFSITDGGYGYTANSQVLVSQQVLNFDNIVTTGNVTNTRNYFSVFETITQPMANIIYSSANGGYFVNNDLIFTYYANGLQQGSGIVLSAANGTSTNGQIFVSILSGNLQSNTIYNSGNSKFASVQVANSYFDESATGNIISESLSSNLYVANTTGTFLHGESIFVNGKSTVNATFVQSFALSNGATSIAIEDRIGTFSNAVTIRGSTSNARAIVIGKSLRIGIINTTGSFLGDSRAPLFTVVSGTSGTMSILNQGSGASFQLANTLLYPENVIMNTDYLNTYANVFLGANAYGFPHHPSGNASSFIFDCLATTSFTFGRIASLVMQTPGSGYTAPPMVRVFEPLSFSRQTIKNQVLHITGATAAFNTNDEIIQSATSARGLVLGSNSSTVTVLKLSVINAFTPTINSTTTISAVSTGVTANLISADDIYPVIDSEDLSEEYLGLDAVIGAKTTAANGTITELQVTSSGWAYEDGEFLTLTSANGISATGEAVLLQQGKGKGFYRTEGGFLSDIKKIHDNDYYQVSAYDVRTSLAFEHYQDMLEALLHVAGTRAFGTFVYRTGANVGLTIDNAIINSS